MKPGFLVVEVHTSVLDAIREEGMDVPLPGNLWLSLCLRSDWAGNLPSLSPDLLVLGESDD